MAKAIALVDSLIEALDNKEQEKKAGFYKPCEDAGPPIPSKYDSKGKIITEEDLQLYIVGNSDDNKNDNAKSETAIILIYDVFGWIETNRNVFRICDNLADNGIFCVMPDYFRKNPWPADKVDPKFFGSDEFAKWFSTVASFDSVLKDTKNIVLPYLKKQGIKKVFAFGLCWGGLMAINLVSGEKAKDEYTGAAVIHAARLTPELIDKVQCPVAIMPASTDGNYDKLKEVLDKKAYGKQCLYKYYENQAHGFMGSRSDWTDAKIKVDVDDALKNTVEFCKQF